jgi:hypothetical protein
MSDPGDPTQVLGEAGEPCRSCGAPLAADQRYCLNCGKRRGEPRIDFREHVPGSAPGASDPGAGALAPDQAAAQTGPATGAVPGGPQRDYTPLAAVGGIAVLGLMLLVGVLIGKGNSSSATSAPAPIVRVGGEGSADTTASAEGKAKAESKQAKGKGSSKGGSKGASNTGSAPVASDEELQKLQEQSPQEYQESSQKLPDEIATGGAPPPTDNKAPGGGSKGTAIE